MANEQKHWYQGLPFAGTGDSPGAQKYWFQGLPIAVMGGQQLVGSTGIASSVAFDSGGQLLTPPYAVGDAGIASSVAFGSGGQILATIVGAAGIASHVAFGATGQVQTIIQGATGIPTSVVFGTIGSMVSINGAAGIPTSVAFGAYGVAGHAELPIQVWIAGVDRTAWVGQGVKRSWSLGSICTCSFPLKSALAGDYRPDEIDEVVIVLEGTYLFFTGWVDNYQEVYDIGGGIFTITVNCVSFAAALEKMPIGLDINYVWPGLIFLIWFVVEGDFHLTADLPMAHWYDVVPSQTFNYSMASEVLRSIGQQFNLMYVVDMNRCVHLFDPDDGREAAPWSVLDSNTGDWQQVTIQRGGLYRNKQGVRTSQQNRSAATSPAFVDLANSTTSRLDQIAFVEDAAEIARVGKSFVAIAEVKDLQSYAAQVQAAQTLLDQGVKSKIKLTLECTRNGLEPGQMLPFNTTIPPLNESLLIEQVDSTASEGVWPDGTVVFRHVVTASNSTFRQGAGIQFLHGLVSNIQNPEINTVAFTFVFILAETIEGLTNPGLSTGLKNIQLKAPKRGVARDLTWTFKTPPATTACKLDILKNGVSIFDSLHLPTIEPGTSTLDLASYIFASDPVRWEEGDLCEIEITQADATAMDGVLQLTVYG